MIFKYIPILDQMIILYQNPRTMEDRFASYMKLVQTSNQKDMVKPLAFFNPMAKEHILEKLVEMRKQDFEEKIEKMCKLYSTNGKQIDFYFNLADDIGGGWTTRESTHDLSLKISPYLKRNCGVVVFYASEEITPELIQERMEFYTNFYNNY
jgi:adenylate kinase family enzyme